MNGSTLISTKFWGNSGPSVATVRAAQQAWTSGNGPGTQL